MVVQTCEAALHSSFGRVCRCTVSELGAGGIRSQASREQIRQYREIFLDQQLHTRQY